MEAVAPDRVIRGAGTTEACWQDWPGLREVAVCQVADIVAPGCRAVVVAPHPDDEILAFGGLMALLAAQGQPTLVVAVTDGDASHPGSSEWPAPALAAQRIEESLEGLRRLGIAAPDRIGLRIPDGAVTAHGGTLLSQLGEIIRPGDVLLSTWTLDGHPDHEATAHAVARASALHGCRHVQAPVWMWHWAGPGDSRVPWTDLRRLELPPAQWLQKKNAIAAHQTQLAPQDTGAGAVLTPASLERLLRRDEFFILSGAQT